MGEMTLERLNRALKESFQEATNCAYSLDWPEAKAFLKDFIYALVYVKNTVADPEKQLELVKHWYTNADIVCTHVLTVGLCYIVTAVSKGGISDDDYFNADTYGRKLSLTFGDAYEEVFKSGEVVKQLAVPLWRKGCDNLKACSEDKMYRGLNLFSNTISEYTAKIHKHDPESYKRELEEAERKRREEEEKRKNDIQKMQEELSTRYGGDVLVWFDVKTDNTYGGAWPIEKELLQSFHVNDVVAVFTKAYELKKVAWVKEMDKYYLTVKPADGAAITIDVGDIIVMFDKGTGIPGFAECKAQKEMERQRRESMAEIKEETKKIGKSCISLAKRLYRSVTNTETDNK